MKNNALECPLKSLFHDEIDFAMGRMKNQCFQKTVNDTGNNVTYENLDNIPTDSKKLLSQNEPPNGSNGHGTLRHKCWSPNRAASLSHWPHQCQSRKKMRLKTQRFQPENCEYHAEFKYAIEPSSRRMDWDCTKMSLQWNV